MARSDNQAPRCTYGDSNPSYGAPPAAGHYSAGFVAGEGLVPLVPVLVFAVLAVAHMRRRNRDSEWELSQQFASPISDEPTPLADLEPWQIGRTLFCPICTDEYLADTDRCEDCGVQLVDEEDLAEPTDARIDEGVVRVLRIRSGSQAQMIRSLFSANRIPCSVLRCTPCDVFGTDVFVFESDALRAKRLVRQFISDPDLVQFR